MALEQNYHKLWFVSFHLQVTTGHRDPIQLKLIPDQEIPDEVVRECKLRLIDPYTLLTSRKENLVSDYPVGTKFLLKVKLTDRDGGGLYFFNYHKWEPIEIIMSK